MKKYSILSAGQFSRADLDHLLSLSAKLEHELLQKRCLNLLNDYILATLFFEPSTRTRLSFESAMHRLGGQVISTTGVQFSSLAKGETIFDTLKMVEAYSDICAIRHPVEGASRIAAQSIQIPVINAGDGAGEHPTQALLDLYTIEKHKAISQKGLRIAFVGDIKYGRTIHSLIQLLWHYDTELVFISPEGLKLPESYRRMLDEHKVSITETDKIEALFECDVAYITRIQEERFADYKEFEKYRDSYVVDRELISRCKPSVSVMHPLPRLQEVSTDLDEHPCALYFEQAKNGLYVRMALLVDLLDIKF